MDLLTAGILSTLADKLANKALDQVIDELPGRLKRLIQGDPERKAALRTAFQSGLEAALKVMDPPDRQRAERYAGLMEHFLGLPETTEELAELVDVRNLHEATLDIPRLEALFRQVYPVGETPEAYEGLNFPAAMRAFARAYSEVIERQADRFPWIEIGLLLHFDICRSRETCFAPVSGPAQNKFCYSAMASAGLANWFRACLTSAGRVLLFHLMPHQHGVEEMTRQPHRPPHLYVAGATYFITGSTYHRGRLFKTDPQKSLLRDVLKNIVVQ
jgi:hypothetical protein